MVSIPSLRPNVASMNSRGTVSKLKQAPLGLALLAALPPAAWAGELDLEAINRYARSGAGQSQEQVTSINQFSDVKPTDWAFQALSNLIERYGCVAGYPNGTFKGGQAMTRYEAAALLNACLDRITEVTDELKRLMAEFEKELAVLRGRVDGLEAKVGELEATQFSTTTKVQGDAAFVIGANSFGGSQTLPNLAAPDTRPTSLTSPRNAFPNNNRATNGATVFNYDVRLNFLTSFTGKDLLYTRLRSGNFANSPFNGRPYNLMALDRAFAPTGGDNVVNIDRLYYRFPIGRDFTALIGPRARNTEFLAITPWYYNGGILDVFTLHGAPGTYNKATGSTFGLMWKQNVKKGKPFFAVSTAYVAPNGANGDPSRGGLLTEGSNGTWTTQAGVSGQSWRFAFAWSYVQCGGQNFRRGTQFGQPTVPCGIGDTTAYTNNFATTLAWRPKSSSWLPSVNLGWGYNALTQASAATTVNTTTWFNQTQNRAASQSWSVGLQWSDVFAKGNAAGMAVGQPVFVTTLRNAETPQDGNFAWEWWYRFQVTDNISVTPAVFYLSRPNGQFTTPGQTSNVFGALVQTQFRF